MSLVGDVPDIARQIISFGWPWTFSYLAFFRPQKSNIDIKKDNLFITKVFISIN